MQRCTGRQPRGWKMKKGPCNEMCYINKTAITKRKWREYAAKGWNQSILSAFFSNIDFTADSKGQEHLLLTCRSIETALMYNKYMKLLWTCHLFTLYISLLLTGNSNYCLQLRLSFASVHLCQLDSPSTWFSNILMTEH